MKRWMVTIGMLLAPLLAGAAGGSLRPVGLRCESLDEPLGIDQVRPSLGWVLESTSSGARGQRQTAYQVLVAGTRKSLEDGTGDIWDSGKVVSDESVHVRYAGKPLVACTEYYWTVRVWDERGRVSPWSRPARWGMGPLSRSDWGKAQWIGKDEKEPTNRLAGTQWIWFPEETPQKSAPVGTRWFRRSLSVPADRKVTQAQFLVAADNEATIQVNGREVGKSSNFRTATEIDLMELLQPGENALAISVRNVGDGPNPAGLVGLVKIVFAEGKPMLIPTDEHWKASDKEADGWQKTGFADAAWPAAKVLGAVGMEPWKEVRVKSERRLPARWLRKEFAVEARVRRATAYLCGLGLSELYVNGKKAGDDVLSPALSEYPKRVYYVAHDVTHLMRRGANAVGVVLGNGRYYAPRLDEPTATLTYGFPKMILLLRLDLEDGTSMDMISDAGWKLTCDGPIRANNEYDGEDYDARMELGTWTRAGYDDRRWEKASLVAAPGGVLAAQMMEPIRVTGRLKPVGVTEPKPGLHIFDMGQNMVGWCRLKISGPAGATVSLRHAETLAPDGTLYLENIRGAKVTDRYTLNGAGQEVYEPRFAYHGFRYVEVQGYPGQPTLTALEGRVVNDDVESGGEFTCSQPVINRVYRNIVWGVRGNYRSIPTDCPQRDERQGWLGDRSAESRGESYLFRNNLLYAKWLQDIADAQKEDGSVSDVCPSYWPMYNDNVTWPSSLVIIPGALLDQFGNVDVIGRQYPAMRKWIEHMSGYLTNNIMPRDTYGDWCVPPEDPKLIHSKDPARKTAGPILGTTYFYHCLKLMARYATLLGKTEDVERYTQRAESLKAGLNERYLNKESGQYDNGAQTTSVLPLAFGMVPADQREKVFGHLVDKITHETKDHIGTGLVGGQWLNRVLSDNGRPDLSYTFATNTTYPSWGYMAEKGATTVWELWNGDTADPAMNSGNHVMLVGDLVIWLYEYLAGIRPDPEQPGFKHIIMRPVPVGDLEFVRATRRSPYGLISSHWQIKDRQFSWEITVPPNTTATVHVPSCEAAAVLEGGRATNAPGVKFVRAEKDRVVFEVGSGQYRWRSRLAP
jgi:alpha-L-rhamnosidase